jgi:transcription elongation factor Elf1
VITLADFEHAPYIGIPSTGTFSPMGTRRAPHIGHKHHLCDMCASGECTLDTVKALVKDAKFICRVCGRAAAKEENLCEPVPL